MRASERRLVGGLALVELLVDIDQVFEFTSEFLFTSKRN